jgi:DNA-binding response OmpR family regulator
MARPIGARRRLRRLERILALRPGSRLLVAPDGETGLRLAVAERPDLVLLDLHLPDLPGDEVLRELRLDARTRSIPVVVLSADATEDRIRRLVAAGARTYLTKPLHIGRLLEVVDAVEAERWTAPAR